MDIINKNAPGCITAEGIIEGSIVELTCNIDDMTGEELALSCEQILAAGALDCYYLTGVMKKGRPGVVLTALCEEEDEAKIAEAVLKYTRSNGLRAKICRKYSLPYEITGVLTPYGVIRVKIARADGILHVKPEYVDIERICKEKGLPYREVYDTVIKMAGE